MSFRSLEDVELLLTTSSGIVGSAQFLGNLVVRIPA